MSDQRAGRPAVGRARLRREARERAIELAYEQQQRSLDVDSLLATLELPPDDFAERLLRTVEQRTDEIDEIIASNLRGWTLARLPVMDHLVLRLSVAELVAFDTPTNVVISEAVDLASRYSTDDSGKFVNGLLASVADTHRSGA